MQRSQKNPKNTLVFDVSWRTKLAKVYIVICLCDFVVFPVLWSIVQVYKGGEVTNAWVPITMAGGGLLHLSFGAILGVSAHAKMKERVSYNETQLERDEFDTSYRYPDVHPMERGHSDHYHPEEHHRVPMRRRRTPYTPGNPPTPAPNPADYTPKDVL